MRAHLNLNVLSVVALVVVINATASASPHRPFPLEVTTNSAAPDVGLTVGSPLAVMGLMDAETKAAALAVECRTMANIDFAHIEDAPTRLTNSTVVPATEDLPAYCRLEGQVVPKVRFELRLPLSNWNGKFFEAGCGGFCGVIPAPACDSPVRKGYACIATDMGNAGGRTNGLVFYNDFQAQIDFGFRGAHVAALAGKALTEYFYSKAPSRSYFMGCSSGGQQALSEAQRFPWDFDGIIAGAPSPTFSGPMMYYEYAGRALLGKVSRADLELVHQKAVAMCDLDDGVKDGIISYPPGCKFDPAELLCQGGGRTGCLNAEQVAAIKKVYAGPMTSKGEKIYTGGPMVGSELNWHGSGPDSGITRGKTSVTGAYLNAAGTAISAWPSEFFRYVAFMPAQGPEGDYREFDFDRDYKRLGMSEALFGNANNPDLRKFAAAGGKMILYQGWADQSDIPSDALDYYETAMKVMGGREATEKFFRLFMIPGMNHCWGGDGAYAIDYVSYMEAWVERGEAPDVMIGAHLADWRARYEFPIDRSRVTFTRPHYPYPKQARYKGTGDPNDAANFRPVEP